MIKQKIFGLDISDHSIEATILQKPFFGKPKISSYARTILRGEIIKNGIIKNPEKLAENIVKLLASARPKPIRTPYCIASLPDSQVFTTIFKFPAGLRRDEIKNTIPYKAEEIIPFKTADIYFDFKSITKKEGTQEVFYAAVPKKIVDDYVKVLKSIGLVPVAFDLESISLARSLVSPGLDIKNNKQKTGVATLLMDIGARTTNLNVFDRHGIRQSLSINIAGDKFTKALAKDLNLKDKDANEMKMRVGFDPKQKKGKVILVLQKELRRIITETQKLINYYQDEFSRQIGSIILTGGSSLLPRIDKYIGENLNLSTSIGNPLKKVSDPKKIINLKTKVILFSTVIGLGLRAVGKKPVDSDINLLPLSNRFRIAPERSEKAAWKKIYKRLVIFGILILIFGGLLILRNKGFDLIKKVYDPSAIQQEDSSYTDGINAEILDQLREQFLIPTSTPITEVEIIEPEIKTQAVIPEIGSGFLNVREGPGTNNPKIGRATSGQQYDLIEEEDEWYHIQLDEETTGWIYSIYADLVEVTIDPTETEPEDVEPEIIDDPVVLPEITIKIRETSLGFLNVREDPGTNNPKIGQVDSGTEHVAIDEQDAWYQIQLDEDTTGWIYSLYVDKIE